MAMRLISWGLIVALLDLRLNGFDMLPDVVGWALVLVGLTELLGEKKPEGGRREFSLARIAALVALVAEVLLLGLYFSERPFRVLDSAADVLVGLATLAMVWWLLHGIAERVGEARLPAGDGLKTQALAPAGWERQRALTLAHRFLVVQTLMVAGACVALVLAATGAEWSYRADGLEGLLVVALAVVAVVVGIQVVWFVHRQAEAPTWVAASGSAG